MRARALLLWATIAAASALAAAPLSCVFTFPDEHGPGGQGGASLTCNVDGDCDDREPCTGDTCVESICRHTAAPDGPLAMGQEAGDCQVIVCAGGASKSEPDDEDIGDDGNDCTLDACEGGVASHVPLPGDTLCEDAMGSAGRCSAEGQCLVPCTTADDCAVSPPNPCVIPSCDTVAAACVHVPVTDGTPTPGAAQTPGDCLVHVCFGGKDVEQEEPSDVLATATDCDVELCVDALPQNAPVAEGSPCSTFGGGLPGFCDDAGVCRECVKDGDCGGRIDDCNYHACVGFSCTIAHDPLGTLTASQALGDCLKAACDGDGGVVQVNDGTDPKSDGNECTSDVCQGTTTVHPKVADGTHCGMGGTLACVNGSCTGCTVNSQCPAASCAANVVTFAQTCDGTGHCLAPSPATKSCAPYLCSATLGGCTTKCNLDSECAAGNYCTGTNGSCAAKLAAGVACGAPGQCQSGSCVDGVCCTTACTGACQACSAAKKGGGASGTCGAVAAGTDPDNECADQGAASCGNDGACNGAGACRKYAAGTVCRAAAGACDVAEACPGSGAACPADGFAPNSTVCRAAAGPCDLAESCTGSSAACPANALRPNGTVCRAAAGACDVAETCNGTVATCPADGFAPSSTVCRAAAGACDVAESCTGSSAACPANGFAPATTVCRAYAGACDVAESCTGTSGTCPADAVLPLGGVDLAACVGTNVCDGQGVGAPHCKLGPGQFCLQGTQCASGVCTGFICG